MSEKLESLKHVISCLNDLDASLSKETIDGPAIMADKVNKLVLSLNGLTKSDFGEEIRVPRTLLEHLDQLGNLDKYKVQMLKEALDNREKFNAKLQYLEDMKAILVEGVEKLHNKDKR